MQQKLKSLSRHNKLSIIFDLEILNRSDMLSSSKFLKYCMNAVLTKNNISFVFYTIVNCDTI